MNLFPKSDDKDNMSSLYRARVVARVDPEKLSRIRVRVYGVHSEDTPIDKLPWALPRMTGGKRWGEMGVPPLETDVWVSFEGGDHEYPVYQGHSPSRKTLIDGSEENEHRYWPTTAHGGEKRTEGLLKNEDGADPEKAPDVFGFVSPLQKRLELDERFGQEKILLADAQDNFIWINSERGVITLEALIGEQTKEETPLPQGLTLNSDPDYQAVQAYTFGKWRFTMSDKLRKAELASSTGHQIILAEEDGENGVQVWTAGGSRLLLNDDDGQVTIKTSLGFGLSIDETNQQIKIFTPEASQYLLLDKGNGLTELFSSGDVKVRAGGSVQIESGDDIELNPVGLLQLDKKSGQNIDTQPAETVLQNQDTREKPEVMKAIPRACDYDFYQPSA